MKFTTATKNKTNFNHFKKAKTLPLMLAISSVLAAPAFADGMQTADGFNNMRNSFGATLATNSYSEDTGTSLVGRQAIKTSGMYQWESKFSVNWGVDVATGVWGYDFGENEMGPEVVNEVGELKITTVYARTKTENLDFSVGVIPLMFGNGWNVQTAGATGASIKYYPQSKTSISVFAAMRDENDSGDDDTVGYYETSTSYDTDGDNDQYMMGIELATGFTNGQAKIYYATDFSAEYDVTDSDTGTVTTTAAWKTHTYGISGKYLVAGINFEGEAMMFSGTGLATPVATTASDVMGTQVHLGATYNISDNAKVQANIYYAKSAGDDEVQVTSIEKLGMIQPLQQGLGTTFNHDEDDFKDFGKPFSIFELQGNGGVMAVGVNGAYQLMPSLTLSAGVIFIQPEDYDALSEPRNAMAADSRFDSLTLLNMGLDYAVSKSVTIGAAVGFDKYDADSDNEDITTFAIGTNYRF